MENIKDFIDFQPETICEIGVFMPNSVQCKDLINDAKRVLLVEANPSCVTELKKIYTKSNTEIINKAIADSNGYIKLYKRNNEDASAFIESVPFSPLIINDNFEPNENYITCESITFDKIDPNNIDILFLDIEGAEWFALKHMKSRPKIITVEMYGGGYVNPYSKEIKNWMDLNHYEPVCYGHNDLIFKKK
jgi:FkbM family methyltransferase